MLKSARLDLFLSGVLVVGLLFSFPATSSIAAEPQTYDVVIYGGTSAGIAAAVQVRKMGGTVLVIEPSRRIGGLTTGGLGQTDIGNKAAIGGLALEFYERIKAFYDQPDNWKWQAADEYRSGGQTRNGAKEKAMWTFEPHAALSVMEDWVRQHDIPVVYEQKLDRSGIQKSGEHSQGVIMQGGRITSIRMENGDTYRGRVFMDATYEGDLLAAAGVHYTVGRESNATYGETLNGVQTKQARHHQIVPGVDPYVVPGDPSSGLLPGIDPAGPGIEGDGDHRVQAYCFRMCLTDHPENRIPFAKPDDYQPLMYELLLRNYEQGERGMSWINSSMPNRKTDTNNRAGFSTDFIGQNYDYPEATYEQREQIIDAHRSYQQGLMWTFANHERVPEAIRKNFARWGTCRDEFEREDGWQQQLYIREARRMLGDYVMTQHHCQGRESVPRPIALAAYTMDSHHVQRFVTEDGFARNEGDVQVGGFSPYPIDYGSLVPKQEQCENLLVPVCLSASHIAFGSIRMEPVFMVLGQTSATAAMQAIAAKAPVQNVDYDKLRERLLADDQVLTWTGPVRTPAISLNSKSLKGIAMDEADAKKVGFVGSGNLVGPFVDAGYAHDEDSRKGEQSVLFQIDIPKAGRYDVRVAYSSHANRATNVPVTIQHTGGPTTVILNQRKKPTSTPFETVGEFDFAAGTTTIEISNKGTNGYVLVDAVQLLPIEKASKR